MMIPIHIMTAAKKAADGDLSTALENVLHTPRKAGPAQGRVAHPLPQVNTAGRVCLAAIIGISLAGAIIGATWGGRGIRFVKEEGSVRPGINDEWAGPNVAPMVARLESDSREIYTRRADLAALLGLKEGDDIADIGAGSGFMSEEFSRLVGERGRVHAVEINPALVAHIQARVTARNLGNVRPHLGEQTRINLNRREGGNFDYVFIADAYHHLEFPQSMLRSAERLLRRRGQLIIVEPRRIPGESPEATLQHVRAGQAEVIREVTAAGLELIDEPLTPFFKVHYVLRFRKD